MLARYELVETLSSRERRLILRMGVQLDARTYAQVQLEDLAEQHKKLLADRQNGNAVLLSAAEYAQYQQTMQLMALLTSGELKLLRRRQKYQRRCHRHKQLAGLKLELKTYVRDRIQHNTPSRPDIYTRRQVLLREEAHE
jgi:PHD/YefM family antitoxin component YafN of YafNO toxin-antitoxin module